MIIKSVTAGNFGSLKGATLDFTEGMNIISGPNESAKSTWHAAIVTAICGLRRGRGIRKEETDFKTRFSPWNSTSWDVSAVVVTDSGDELNVSQDLANLVSSQVLKLGKDVTAQFESEGSPDLSSLVGLRRDIFGSTASIRQADIRLSVENAKGLQEAIQSAISTAGSGSAAAGAIAAITNYKQQHVGIARANAVKPLQLAIEARDMAKDKLARAEDYHFQFLAQLEKVENLDREARTFSNAISATEIDIKAHEILALEADIEQISAEIEKFGSDKPDEKSESSDLDQAVAQAIADWKAKLTIANMPSPSSNEIAAEMLLVADPVFDPKPNLDNCKNDLLRNSIRDLERLESDLITLRNQFTELDTQSSDWVSHPRVEQNLPPVTTVAPSQKNSNKNAFLAGAAISVAFAIAGVAINQIIISAIFGISALVALVLAIRNGAVETNGQIPSTNQVSLPANNPFVDLIARKEDEINKKNGAILDAKTTISNVLLNLGFPISGGDFRIALAQYIFTTQCDEIAAKRTAIQDRLDRAKELERKIHEDKLRNIEILAALRDIALRCEIKESADKSGDSLLADLNVWLSNRDNQRASSSNAKASWVMRETIQKGRTFEEMKEELAKLRNGLENHIPSSPVGASREELLNLLRQLREDESTATTNAANARGSLETLINSNSSVTDCEQELQEANSELERLESLARILDKTAEFLELAQTNVHRDIAPILQDAICAKLPAITNGRYTSAIVDPEDLSVKIDVSNGIFKDANYLSYGTTEQIYLLLRIALIDHLTGGKDSCPIICDDITVHADSDRTIGILTLLKEISKTRQVIVFSQEAEVLAWGKKNLNGDTAQVKTL